MNEFLNIPLYYGSIQTGCKGVSEEIHTPLLTLSTLGKIFSSWHIEIFFLFSPENRIWHFMQIVSTGDNLHEMSYPVFWKK